MAELIGSGSTLLPGVKLSTGVAIGAMSLVNKSCPAFGVYFGTPIKFLKKKYKFINVDKNI